MSEVLEKTVLTIYGMTAKQHAQHIVELLDEIEDTKILIDAIQKKCKHENYKKSHIKDYYAEDEYGRSTGYSTKYYTCEDCGVRICFDYDDRGNQIEVRFNYGKYEGD